MATSNENKMIELRVGEYWLKTDATIYELVLRIQHIVFGANRGYNPELVKDTYQLDKYKNWSLRIVKNVTNPTKAILDFRYRDKASQAQWQATDNLICWRLGGSPPCSKTIKQPLTATIDPRWFQREPVLLARRVQGIVRDNVTQPGCEPEFKDGRWQLTPGKWWFMQIGSPGTNTIIIDYSQKEGASQVDWDALREFIDWRLGRFG